MGEFVDDTRNSAALALILCRLDDLSIMKCELEVDCFCKILVLSMLFHGLEKEYDNFSVGTSQGFISDMLEED